MTDKPRAAEIRGKTIRLTWTEGPTKGTTHEHIFHEDGTVEWHSTDKPQKADSSKEKPEYAAMKVADGICCVVFGRVRLYPHRRPQLPYEKNGRVCVKCEGVAPGSGYV